MTEQKRFLSAMTILGLLLAIGMSSAAFILGVQAKRAVSGQQTIAVKGLSRKTHQSRQCRMGDYHWCNA